MMIISFEYLNEPLGRGKKKFAVLLSYYVVDDRRWGRTDGLMKE